MPADLNSLTRPSALPGICCNSRPFLISIRYFDPVILM